MPQKTEKPENQRPEQFSQTIVPSHCTNKKPCAVNRTQVSPTDSKAQIDTDGE